MADPLPFKKFIQRERIIERPDGTAAVRIYGPPGCTLDEPGHVYRIDGMVVPSVTQVLDEEHFLDFTHIPIDQLEPARERGGRVHKWVGYAIEGEVDFDTISPPDQGYVRSALEYLAQTALRVVRDDAGCGIGVEFRFWDRERWFAGTIDYLGWDGEVLTIVDWKTGDPQDVAAGIQTAGYERGARAVLPRYVSNLPKPLLVQRRTVRLSANGAPGRAAPCTDPRDHNTFASALTVVQFRRNHFTHRPGVR